MLTCYSPFHTNFKYTGPEVDVCGIINPQVLMPFSSFFSPHFLHVFNFQNAILSKMFSFLFLSSFCLIFKTGSIRHNLFILELVFTRCFQLILSSHSLASRSFLHSLFSFFHCLFSYISVNVSLQWSTCCHLSTLLYFLSLPPFLLLYHFSHSSTLSLCINYTSSINLIMFFKSIPSSRNWIERGYSVRVSVRDLNKSTTSKMLPT